MNWKLLIGCLATIACAAPLHAADIEAPPPEFSWSGFYVGAVGGHSWSDFDVDADQPDLGPFDLNQSFDVDGFMIGGEIGWNHQMESVVVGLAADIAYVDAREKSDFDTENGDEVYIGKLKWFATLRGRLGYALDNVLIYATGGLAATEAEFAFEDQDETPVLRFEDSDTLWGWTAGGGVEVAVNDLISVKAEYLYADFGSLDFSFFGGDPSGEVDITTQMLRGGVLFHF